MADIQTVVKSALSGIGVPVFLGNWQGSTASPAQYVTYTTRHYKVLHADDKSTEDEYFVYLEIWSDTSYLTLKGEVTTAMETAGFNLVEEVDVEKNHLSMTWYGVA